MTITPEALHKMAHLAYLTIDEEQVPAVCEEISAIMDFVEQLRTIDTTGVAPLFHPLAAQQRLRVDEVTEAECIAELEAIAPMFEDNLYLVPKVIDAGTS